MLQSVWGGLRVKRVLFLASFAVCGSAVAAPLFPTIFSHDFNFGAFNAPDGGPEWATNGLAPDTLSYIASPGHTEVTALWPFWPAPPVVPVFNVAGAFGGDFILQVQFTGQDAPYVGPGGVIDVSLTGTGANSAGADLVILGAIPALGIPFSPLWALELDRVSLYGRAGAGAPIPGFPSYVLEGAGVIVGGAVAQQFQLIGRPGVMRGHLDFRDTPGFWIPPLYHPLLDPLQAQFRAAYSGETGHGTAIPEPGTMAALGLGAAALLAKRRRK